ncbi:MAG: DNA phosphorothioation-associated protein 4 [Microcoleaceae cyanobacterium]
MSQNRVRIAKEKAEFVKSLTAAQGKVGPFQTYADAIVFAATLGLKRKKRVPVETVSKREPAPISMEVFISRGYDVAIKLISLSETQDTAILSQYHSDAETQRTQIFEEYANGGLEILQEEFRGSVDYTSQILLLLTAERNQTQSTSEEFDLSRFL